MTSRISRTLVFVVLCLIAVSTVYPLIFMALNSMRSSSSFELSPFGFPSHWNFSSYRNLFQEVPFAQSILHSFIVVVPAVILATFTSSLAAFVFTKVPVKLGNAMFWVMLMIMFMPGIVVLLPLYVEVAHTGLSNNFVPAILIYTAISIPYGTYLLRSNFRSIPDSVVEASRVDGASWFKVYWRVILPIGRPGIFTVGILTFLNIWNDLFISLVLLHASNTEMVTPTLAQLSGKYSTDVPVLMAGLLIGALPTLLLYFVTARVFIRGMLSRSGALNMVVDPLKHELAVVSEVKGPSGADRVLAILNLLGTFPDGVGLNDLARLMNSPRSSVHRALGALRRADLIEQDRDSRYRLGYGLLKLAFTYYDEIDAVGRMRPVLSSLAAEFGETTHYAILDRSEVVYLAKVQPPLSRYQMNSVIGGRNPAYCTGVGKALLAYNLTTRDQVDRFVADHEPPLAPFTNHTILTAEQLHAEFELIRENGYALDREEHEEGINCLAIPLFLTSRTLPDGAISITAVARRFPLTKLETSIDHAREMIREYLGEVMA